MQRDNGVCSAVVPNRRALCPGDAVWGVGQHSGGVALPKAEEGWPENSLQSRA